MTGLAAGWRVWVDTGGTFTDAIGIDPCGAVHRTKILSSGALRGTIERVEPSGGLIVRVPWDLPASFLVGFRLKLLHKPGEAVEVVQHDPTARRLVVSAPPRSLPQPGDLFELSSHEEAPIVAARLLTRTPPGAALPVAELRLGTTRGTNALLERRGASVAFFTTRGFGDLLEIGDQARPDLFELDVKKPASLAWRIVEVSERLDAQGRVLEPMDLADAISRAKVLRAEGCSCAAVALLHSVRFPGHEQALGAALRELGFEQVSLSSELSPFQKILPRAQTALVDAYLAPSINTYLARVQDHLGGGRLRVMTSAGGLVEASSFRARDSLLSGPAGGARGAWVAARSSGLDRVLAFDMGGTSTDVTRIAGEPEQTSQIQIGGARLMAPAVAIETVAAGGGSVCTFRNGELHVGPESAGALPGPACHGDGGPLTITDVNLLLGRLDPESFEIPLLPAESRARLADLLHELEAAGGEPQDAAVVLEGLLEIANERMAAAIRKVSTRRGFDPADHALLAFGGAGGQHACAIAARLGVSTILVPPDAGLLSAVGIGHSPVERIAQREVLARLADFELEIPERFSELERAARSALLAEGLPGTAIEVRRRTASLRYLGQESCLELDHDLASPLGAAFEKKHRELFGHTLESRPIELVSLGVAASTRVEIPAPTLSRSARKPEAARHLRGRVNQQWQDLPVYRADDLGPGAALEGPALVLQAHGTTFVDAGWSADVDPAGALLLRHAGNVVARQENAGQRWGNAAGGSRAETPKKPPASSLAGTASERSSPPRSSGGPPTRRAGSSAVELELFTCRFQAIVEEMGGLLERTALSTNVKERLDYSCALLDPAGRLVVNAPHIPVHLGALGLCVRTVALSTPLEPGDVVVTNHPAWGGSHLPDVTLITPVHGKSGSLLGYVANRAHHAEIGGTTPGSMPPGARTLAEEGIVLPPTLVARRGRVDWTGVKALLSGGPYPSRSVEENLADLAAAYAANHAGARGLRALAEGFGEEAVRRHMLGLQALAAGRVVEALGRLPGEGVEGSALLDDGTRIHARLTRTGAGAILSFEESGPVHPGNLNATPAIVQSAALYALRLLVGEALPLNEGLLDPIELVVPPGILHPPFAQDPSSAPAVFGGNVETSQALANLLVRIFGLAAESQGTMNNLIFGTRHFGYYETICGGCGAGPGFNGASAVHSHMTNTRITDPEVLEHRYPARVVRFQVRRGSGGAGRWRGGDGVVREILFLTPVTLSVLGQHRCVGPCGERGGSAGAPGRVTVIRADGEIEILGSSDGRELEAGDRVIVETPGGGGWGPVEQELLPATDAAEGTPAPGQLRQELVSVGNPSARAAGRSQEGLPK